jgi:hypothetical protein
VSTGSLTLQSSPKCSFPGDVKTVRAVSSIWLDDAGGARLRISRLLILLSTPIANLIDNIQVALPLLWAIFSAGVPVQSFERSAGIGEIGKLGPRKSCDSPEE